jgi:acyl carrier protein
MTGNSITIDINIISEFVKRSTYKEANLIDTDTLLFREGFFDSMGFVLLIDFIEEKFKIKTSDEDLIEENFESINAISEFVSRKINNR